jgi:hypothetical protein
VEFLINNSWWNQNQEQPFPTAYRKTYARLEKVLYKSVQEIQLEKMKYVCNDDKRFDNWLEEGFGHTNDEDGYLMRYIYVNAWFIDFSDLESLIQFVNKNNVTVLCINNIPTIEI